MSTGSQCSIVSSSCTLIRHHDLTPCDRSPGGDNSGDEDCLFLNVYSPQNATNLPVLVWIRKSLVYFSMSSALSLAHFTRMVEGTGLKSAATEATSSVNSDSIN